ncbi:hypothetical protein ES705_25926 [subsurface metagenome]
MDDNSYRGNNRSTDNRIHHWRACILIALLFAAIILTASDMPDPRVIERNQVTLRFCLGLLIVQFETILRLIAREDVDLELKIAISDSLRICQKLLEMLKYR